MKILILTNYDVGLYQFRRELIEELLKRNEVLISLPYGKLVEPLKEMGCEFIETPLDRRGINPLTDFKLIRTYKKIVKRVNPDLVITYTIKPNVYGGYVCRRKKIPYAINITGLGTAFQKKGLLRSFVTFLYKLGLKKAKVVFFENIENKQVFIDEKIVNEEHSCLLNGAGVNLEHYYYAPYPEESDVTRFLFMGRVMKEKGIDELFEAMHRLFEEGIHCELTVLGGYEEDYKEIIDKYSNEGWLKYEGYKEDVRPFIEKAHCYVLPSWHEGMANSNLECAAMGRPVITSNIHGCKEAVEDGVSGFLCEKQNSDSLYSKMMSFINMEYELKKRMSNSAREHVEKYFDKRIIVKKTMDRAL